MSYVESLLADGERIIITGHRHWLFLLGRIVLFAIATGILIGAGVWAWTSVSTILGIGLALLALVPLGWGILRFIDWRNEQYIVTNYRIIQFEGVFNRQVFDSSLEKVNDLLLNQSLMGRFFNYGTIQIITGSDMGLNRLDALSNPFVFKKAIVDARNDLGDEDRAPQPVDQLVRLLSALDELRQSGVITADEYEAKRSRLLAGSSIR